MFPGLQGDIAHSDKTAPDSWRPKTADSEQISIMRRHLSGFLLTDSGKIVLLLASILLLALGGAKLGQLVSARMLRADALSTSDSWADSLVDTVDDLPAIIAGAPLSEGSRRLLTGASQVGDIYRYRIWDRNGRLVFASERMPSPRVSGSLAALRGRQAADAILTGTELTDTREGDDLENPRFFAVSCIPIREKGAILGVFEVYLDQTADKALYEHSFFLTESIIALMVLLAGGVPAFMVYRKMLEHRAAQAQAAYQAEHDNLTGVPNRSRLKERATAAIAQARQQQRQVAALLVDLDRFKEINDSFGHSAGDEVLRAVGQRLKASIRADDWLVRLGGDEFVVLQTGAPQPEGGVSLARRLLEALREPYRVGDIELNCGSSIGVAVAPGDADDWDSLLTCADAAMYKAKSEGRNTICFFEPGMDAVLRERRHIEIDLRRALDSNAFRLAFQPLLDCSDRHLIGFEALLRWPEGWPPQSPAAFIPVAEESGLMIPLGAWVLESACRAAAAWKEPLKIAVNLSPMQFRHGDVLAAVENALHVTGLAPERLELEVTESVWLQNTEVVLEQLGRLRKMGITIALDDFGTGYSSLSYLWRFPFDIVKIDRSFVSEMETESKAAAIVNTIVGLARTLRLTVVAEGVETSSQAQALKEAGCDQAQGYLFGRPMSGEQACAFIETESTRAADAARELSQAVVPVEAPARG